GQSVATLTVNLSYTNLDGSATYTEALTITLNLKKPSAGGPARPTATPTLISRPQLVVTAYQTDVDPLQPGAIFELKLDIRNLGTANARSVTMVLGGGASVNEQGTPVPGGSELSTFAPLGASNLIFLGDVPVGSTISATQKLIVNVTANPGAYPFKLSFIYDDEKGARQVNDQVITLLIYQLPQVEVGFYRDPGIFYTNQMSMLPLQVTNLGRKTAVLGNLRVTSPNADITNNVTLVGSLEPGGYFTLDANILPFQPGPLDIEININYTDDFNQPRTITQTLTVEVMEMPTPEFPTDGFPTEPPPPVEETFWQKVLRFLRGLIGLDSAEPTPAPSFPLPGEEMPPEGIPGQPMPVPVEPLPRPKG
ncbi:MAG: COG1361 S-layer family protein, partial [Bellilinea sp.]